jgi:hypothetical protein
VLGRTLLLLLLLLRTLLKVGLARSRGVKLQHSSRQQHHR